MEDKGDGGTTPEKIEEESPLPSKEEGDDEAPGTPEMEADGDNSKVSDDIDASMCDDVSNTCQGGSQREPDSPEREFKPLTDFLVQLEDYTPTVRYLVFFLLDFIFLSFIHFFLPII